MLIFLYGAYLWLLIYDRDVTEICFVERLRGCSASSEVAIFKILPQSDRVAYVCVASNDAKKKHQTRTLNHQDRWLSTRLNDGGLQETV